MPEATTKLKKFFIWLFLISSVLFFVFLFLFKNTLTKYTSNAIKAQAGSEIQNSESAFIDSAYNYKKNGLSYEITFLEFGSKCCSACKRMESVMSEMTEKYPNQVNVLFINILLPENQKLMKYFGITAIPTQVLLNKEGKEFFVPTGYYSVDELSQKIISN